MIFRAFISIAVITGGASGIGLAMAQYWTKRGGKVVIGDIAEEPFKNAADQITGEAAMVVCNVTDENDCARLADTAIEKFGRINLVAPFAGIIMDGLMVAPGRKTGKVKKKMSLSQFQKVVQRSIWDFLRRHQNLMNSTFYLAPQGHFLRAPSIIY